MQRSFFVLLGIALLGQGLQAAVISGTNSPAHFLAKKFLRGANLGNYLEAPPNQNWGASYSTEDFVNIHREGFDHVRIPIAWHHYTGPAPDFKLSAAIFSKVDFLLTSALSNQLSVIINLHHFDEFTSAPLDHTNKLFAIWRQIAERYARTPDNVAFELLNEPKDAATTEVLNPIYAKLIRQIRASNPRRVIFLGPGKWNQVSELPNLHLPGNEDNVIVTVHCYDPFYFTHQGATWAGPDVKGLKGIKFPGPPEQPFTPDPSITLRDSVKKWVERYNTEPAATNPSGPSAFREKLAKAKAWSDENERPVHVGEFGCYMQADPESRARFYAEFRKALRDHQLGWAVWDWKAGFRYWDAKANAPAPGMREALFGASAKPQPNAEPK
jgi:endoglucanase